MSKELKGYINIKEPIKIEETDDRDGYIEFQPSLDEKCINCEKKVGFTFISQNELTFCGFKCLIHYYIKELKEEGKI